jgi:hypothetical protein
MKNFLLTLFVSFLLVNAAIASSNSLREEFHTKDLNRENVEQMIATYSSDNSPVDQAYLGVCQAIMAQYVFLPTTKLRSFYNGKDLLDTSIEEDGTNGEQRYLRLLIQLNAPSFLLYNKNIDKDLEVFIEDVKNNNIDPKWSNVFIENLLKGKKLSQQQIEDLTQLKKELI